MSSFKGTDSGKWTMPTTSSEHIQLEAHSSSDGGSDLKPLPRDVEPDSKLLPQDDGINPNPLTYAVVSDPAPRVQDVESDPKLLPQDEPSDNRNPLPECAELEPKLLPEDIGSEINHLAQDVAALLHDGMSDQNPLPQVIYRCKKCRQIVASEENIVPHEHGKGEECFKYMREKNRGEDHGTPPECTSVFVDPMKWMQPVQEGYLYEKLYCMGCKSRLGAFNWCGMQCSCGAWVNPAFQLHKSRIDECRI